MSRQRSFGCRGLSAVLLILLVLSSIQHGLVGTQALAAEQIAIKTDKASSDFPDGIDFSLDARSDHEIQRIELLYQAADIETLNLEVPDFKPGKHVSLKHTLDFHTNFEPSGIDITYHWRITDDAGNVTESEPKVVQWFDNRFDWQSTASSDVTLYTYYQNPAFAKIILDTAQRTVDRLKVMYGLDTVTPFRIWAYNKQKDFLVTQQANGSDAVAATTYPQFHVIASLLPEGGIREVGRVIPHEVSHQLLYQATKNPFNAPPTWLDEGLAVSNQESGNEDSPALVKDAAEKGQLFSIRSLKSDFPLDYSDMVLAYAESYSIVQFIITTYGEDKLAAVIAAYRDGVSHDEALRRGLGVDTDQLDQLWKANLDYPGDKPRATGTTSQPSHWTDFFGTGLASGALVVFVALIAVALFRLASARRFRRHAPRLG
jgi:hypothetical protein